MHVFVENVQNSLLRGDLSVIGIVVAIIVVLFTILIYAFGSGKNKNRGILLVGLCDAGKTTLYSKLVDNRFVQTHTSMKENAGTYMVKADKKGTLRIIDLPGHERLRFQFLEQYKTLARAYIFVVDSLTITKDIKDTAEFLYTLLTDPGVQKTKSRVLILCNKHDQPLAKGVKVIQSMLEKEINTLRVTQSAALESTSTTGSSSSFIGKKAHDFKFADLKANKVDFVEGSAKGSKDSDLRAVEAWLVDIA